MAQSKTTFSIEIFAGLSVENNAYGVPLRDVKTRMNELLDNVAMHRLLSSDGLTVEIREEK